jgi:glycine cleavage system aminomethyltransferase T
MIVVNAANRRNDFAWMTGNPIDARLRDISSDVSQIAVQGPASEDIMLDVLTKGVLRKILHIYRGYAAWRAQTAWYPHGLYGRGRF